MASDSIEYVMWSFGASSNDDRDARAVHSQGSLGGEVPISSSTSGVL